MGRDSSDGSLNDVEALLENTSTMRGQVLQAQPRRPQVKEEPKMAGAHSRSPIFSKGDVTSVLITAENTAFGIVRLVREAKGHPRPRQADTWRALSVCWRLFKLVVLAASKDKILFLGAKGEQPR